MRKTDKMIQIIHFSATNISMKIEKAKIRCEIQILGKNLRQWRREINQIVKSMNEIDKKGTEANEKAIPNGESGSLDSNGSTNA